jgi:hypothetical protein
MAHKKQLGGNKFISKVRVFKPDQGSLPYMLFYVDGPAPPNLSTGSQLGEALRPADGATVRQDSEYWRRVDSPGMVQRTEDGTNVLREHFLWAKL